ncbi:TIGR01906 family membrane protein [Lachnospiraceae bacterium]|jgi:integral membrane protein (TIGR01906 family)|nr:TIGR01906 family membrane protein [uncultured Schaedlerella sp.]MCI9152347.1 TIGR01906 family membrane protein [Ruminococcus sp.]NBI56663.1 TIGR01906 family membrane protein [Lachnospiraceae bacterium]
MKGLRWIAGGAASIAAVVILLISSFQAAMYLDFGIYEKEYTKYQVLRALDMEMEDAMYVTREMMAYLKGDRERLSVVTTVEGKEQDFFNEQDRLHMEDVQGLFLGGLAMRRWAFAVLAAALVILAAVCRKEMWKTLAGSFLAALGILAALILFLGIAMARNFNAVFTKFHEIFFDNDLWIFDPAEDYMIRMLPEGLFFDMVIRIGGFFLAGLTVLLILSIVYTVRSRKAGDGRILAE